MTVSASSPSGQRSRWDSVVAYAVGSIGAFLVFHWPGLLRQIILGYLIVFLAVRIAAVLGRFLLAPANDRFRVCPMEAAAARYWYVRLKLIVGWTVLGLGDKGRARRARNFSAGARHRRLWVRARHAGDSARSHLAAAGSKGPGGVRARARNPPFEPHQDKCAADCWLGVAMGAPRCWNDARVLVAYRRYGLAACRPIDPAGGRASAAPARYDRNCRSCRPSPQSFSNAGCGRR